MRQSCPKCGAETAHLAVCGCGAEVRYQPKARTPRAKAPLESVVKAAICKALRAAGVQVWVHNVDNRALSTGLGIGTADLICVVPPTGRFLGIEVKRPGYTPSRVSDAQRAWGRAVEAAGGVAGIASSVEEAMVLVRRCKNEKA